MYALSVICYFTLYAVSGTISEKQPTLSCNVEPMRDFKQELVSYLLLLRCTKKIVLTNISWQLTYFILDVK